MVPCSSVVSSPPQSRAERVNRVPACTHTSLPPGITSQHVLRYSTTIFFLRTSRGWRCEGVDSGSPGIDPGGIEGFHCCKLRTPPTLIIQPLHPLPSLPLPPRLDRMSRNLPPPSERSRRRSCERRWISCLTESRDVSSAPSSVRTQFGKIHHLNLSIFPLPPFPQSLSSSPRLPWSIPRLLPWLRGCWQD